METILLQRKGYELELLQKVWVESGMILKASRERVVEELSNRLDARVRSQWNQTGTKMILKYNQMRKESGITTDPAAGGTRFGALWGSLYHARQEA